MNSSKRLSFFWIDDSASRSSMCEQLVKFKTHKGITATAHFIHVKGDNPAALFSQNVSANGTPDLVVMDHFLNCKPPKQEGIPTKGSTVAEFIRENYRIPIVAITGAAKIDDVERYKDAYDDVCDVTNFRGYIDSLYTIALGFQKLRQKKITTKAHLLNLFKACSEDYLKLQSILPEDLIGKDGIIVPRLFRWTWNVFSKRPGLLYNREWIATFIGLKADSFHKVEKLFSQAKYDGIFADPSKPLWWPTKAGELLYKLAPSNTSQKPWDQGHNLSDIGPRDFSRCALCRGLSPEIMGFTDESRQHRIPLHLKCSEVCSTANKALFFEEDRKIRDDR